MFPLQQEQYLIIVLRYSVAMFSLSRTYRSLTAGFDVGRDSYWSCHRDISFSLVGTSTH